MAVRLSLALKVLFPTNLYVGAVTIMTSNHENIKYETKASTFTGLFIFLEPPTTTR